MTSLKELQISECDLISGTIPSEISKLPLQALEFM